MRALVIRAPNVCNAAVSGHDNNGCGGLFQGPVQEREALYVKHVHLINEKHPRDNICLALFAPFGNLLIDLLANFSFDFTCVPGKKSKKALLSAVNDIDL